MKKVLSFLIYSPPWVHQELIQKKGEHNVTESYQTFCLVPSTNANM
jgi:hypothetical protein